MKSVMKFFWALSLMVAVMNVALVSSSWAHQPEWLQKHLEGSLKIRDVYHGVSFAKYSQKSPDYDTQRLAKDRALDELCYQLSVSIQSEFEDQVVKKGQFEEQQIASSLFISTRKVLSGVEEKFRWLDKKRRQYWILLTIDRDRADQQVAQQTFINEVVDRLEHKQDEILNGMEQMAAVLDHNMQHYNERMDQFETLLNTIDSKIEASGSQVKDEYASLRKEILRLEKTRKSYEEILAESEKRQSQQIEALMAQNEELKVLMSGLTQKINKDYFLALTNDDLKYKQDASTFHIRMQPDKGQGADYFDGEKIRFLIKANQGCYIKVIYISSTSNGGHEEKRINTLLFPNEHDRNNWIEAGERKIIGRLGEIIVQEPFGKDIVTVVASKKQFTDLNDVLKGNQAGFYSVRTRGANDSIALRTRGIAVAKSLDESPIKSESEEDSQKNKVATDTCFIVSHPK